MNEKRVVGKAGCWVHPNKPNKKGYVQIAKDSSRKGVFAPPCNAYVVYGPDAVPAPIAARMCHISVASLLAAIQSTS